MSQQSKFSEMTRRHFMHGAAAGLLAGGAMTQLASAQTAPAEGRKVGYALVGLGNLTVRQILPALKDTKLSKAVALVSGDPEKARRLASEFGVDPTRGIYNYENYDSIADNPAVDVIYIALPNGMHAEYTVRGAKAGKHILCEKPMANTVAECRQMIDACNAAKKKLMIGYRLRYEPINTAAIQMVRDKVMGMPRMITAEAGFYLGAPDPKNLPWRLNKKLAGGGALLDIGIYALNATRYLSGEEPIEVNATSYTPPNDPRFAEVEDAIVWQLKFPSGILANCATSYSAGQNRFRVVGRDGFIESEPFLSYSNLQLHKVIRGKQERVDLPQVNHFAAEFEHMSECVLQDKEPLTPGEEGLKDLKVIEAIYEAIETKKTVKLS
ncbi:MAG TPA: Gfo/Idh/MocA family oxidoreductase [Tepidisphaeraceae bacterium]|nr:Gfo/Idh/MocA family oxidoreductase [Tepidisphaeraceae bacterium]